MYMHYITATSTIGNKETLIAVVGDERVAKSFQESYNLLGGKLSIKSLVQLRKDNVVVPVALNWIVEADERFQKRVIDDRLKNLVGACALTTLPGTWKEKEKEGKPNS
jgi:hypothetical protein